MKYIAIASRQITLGRTCDDVDDGENELIISTNDDYMMASKRAQQMTSDIALALSDLVMDTKEGSLLSCFYPMFTRLTQDYMNEELIQTNASMLQTNVDCGVVIIAIQVLMSYMHCSSVIHKEQLAIIENRLLKYMQIFQLFANFELVKCDTSTASSLNGIPNAKCLRELRKKGKRSVTIDDEEEEIDNNKEAIVTGIIEISQVQSFILIVSKLNCNAQMKIMLTLFYL